MSDLKKIELDEVSVVDAGANPGANILLAKRKNAAVVSALEKKMEQIAARLSAHIQKAEAAEFQKIASKYELLGENVEELAKVLKKAKETPAYDKLISLLDKELNLVEKSGLFAELGKSGAGQTASIKKIAAQIRKKNPTLSKREAIEKAFELNPQMEY